MTTTTDDRPLDALVVHATTEGHTARIAARLAERLAERGLRVRSSPVNEHGTLPGDDPEPLPPLVIAGSPVHVGRHDPGLVRWARGHAKDLGHRAVGLFSVSLSAAGRPDEVADAERLLAHLVGETGWTQARTTVVAGAISWSRYGFLKRFLMKRVLRKGGRTPHPDHDEVFTDWAALDAFADRLAGDLERLRAEPGVPGGRSGQGASA